MGDRAGVMRAGLIGLMWLVVLMLARVAFAQAPAAIDFPALSGRVVDRANLLAPADQAGLSDQLAALEAKTGDQVVVVTLPSLHGLPIEEYGYQLGRHWGIGQKGANSGALLIVDAGAHQVRIEVGYGLEGTLTDAATKTIIESDMLPRFKAGDFPGGIKAGVADITALLGAEPAGVSAAAAPPLGVQPPAATITWPGIALGVGFVVLLIFCGLTGGGLCQGLMQMLFMFSMFGRGGRSEGGSGGFSGGGGSFGGGGSSGSW